MLVISTFSSQIVVDYSLPGAHRDLSMWKPLQANEMMKSFDLRERVNINKKIDNYNWMIPIDFRKDG